MTPPLFVEEFDCSYLDIPPRSLLKYIVSILPGTPPPPLNPLSIGILPQSRSSRSCPGTFRSEHTMNFCRILHATRLLLINDISVFFSPHINPLFRRISPLSPELRGFELSSSKCSPPIQYHPSFLSKSFLDLHPCFTILVQFVGTHPNAAPLLPMNGSAFPHLRRPMMNETIILPLRLPPRIWSVGIAFSFLLRLSLKLGHHEQTKRSS